MCPITCYWPRGSRYIEIDGLGLYIMPIQWARPLYHAHIMDWATISCPYNNPPRFHSHVVGMGLRLTFTCRWRDGWDGRIPQCTNRSWEKLTASH